MNPLGCSQLKSSSSQPLSGSLHSASTTRLALYAWDGISCKRCPDSWTAGRCGTTDDCPRNSGSGRPMPRVLSTYRSYLSYISPSLIGSNPWMGQGSPPSPCPLSCSHISIGHLILSWLSYCRQPSSDQWLWRLAFLQFVVAYDFLWTFCLSFLCGFEIYPSRFDWSPRFVYFDFDSLQPDSLISACSSSWWVESCTSRSQLHLCWNWCHTGQVCLLRRIWPRRW